jgi:hypothetical protein
MAEVVYDAGKPNAVHQPIPQAKLIVLPCKVILDKKLDANTHTVTLTVRNGLKQTIDNVVVNEHVMPNFRIAEPIDPVPTSVTHDGRIAEWNVGSLTPDEERRFKFRLAKGPTFAPRDYPLPIDDEGALVNYAADVLKLKIDRGQTEYHAFEQDVQNCAISQSTSKLLRDTLYIAMPIGTQIRALSSGSQSEYGWEIDPGGWRFKVKRTNEGYELHHNEGCRELFPPGETPPKYAPA